MKTFIPKDDNRLPDFYTIKVEEITGKTREYKVVSHTFFDGSSFFKEGKEFKYPNIRAIQLLTYENEYVLIPLDNVFISFDKNFTKIIEIKNEVDLNG